MKLLFFASFRDLIGKRSVEYCDVDEPTVSNLLLRVVQDYPQVASSLVDDNGRLLGHILVLVNGRDVRFLENGLNSKLDQEDEVSIFPAIGGG
jgi:MoaD family protein